MLLPKVKPVAIVPRIRRKAVLVPKVARRLLADQYRARQGNLTQATNPQEGTAATEYGERQIHQTLQGTAHTLFGAAQGWESGQREYLDTLLADFREELAALVPDAIKQPPAASGSTA